MTAEELKNNQKEIDEKIKEKYSQRINEIVFDGPFDFDKYAKEDVKILFLMREPNSSGVENNDYKNAKLYYDHFFGAFNTVAEIILNKSDFDTENQKLSDNWGKEIIDKKSAIFRTAFINLSNLMGRSSVGKNGSVSQLADNNKDLLIKKIDSYSPDIIITPDCDVISVWNCMQTAIQFEKICEDDIHHLTKDCNERKDANFLAIYKLTGKKQN